MVQRSWRMAHGQRSLATGFALAFALARNFLNGTMKVRLWGCLDVALMEYKNETSEDTHDLLSRMLINAGQRDLLTCNVITALVAQD